VLGHEVIVFFKKKKLHSVSGVHTSSYLRGMVHSFLPLVKWPGRESNQPSMNFTSNVPCVFKFLWASVCLHVFVIHSVSSSSSGPPCVFMSLWSNVCLQVFVILRMSSCPCSSPYVFMSLWPTVCLQILLVLRVSLSFCGPPLLFTCLWLIKHRENCSFYT
jgi:hypothetical protein